MVVMVKVKAVTLRIGVIVHRVKTCSCSQHSQSDVNDECFCTDNSC